MMGRREEIQRKFGFEVEGGGRGRWAVSSSNLVIEQVLNEKERRQSVRPAWLACREFIRAPPRPHQHGPPGATAAAILQPVSPRRSLAGRGTGLACSHRLMRAQGRAAGHHLPFYVWIFFCLSQSPLPSPASSIKRASLDPGRGGQATGTSDGARMK